MKDAEQLGQVRPYQGPMSYVMRFVRAGIALAIMGVLGWLAGCSDNPGGPVCCDPPQGLVVSDPVPAAGLAAGTGAALAFANGAGDSVVYVSLPPGTAPAGSRAAIRRVGDVASLTTAVLDGGFDPVPVEAQAEDSIEVLVTDAAGGTVLQARLAVAAARPPIVVRTDPPRRKTDVPLNAAIVIVFSEPVDAGTLTPSSVQLLRGGSPVAGAVRLLQGTGTAAAFTPAAPLVANTAYQLVVTQAVKDLDGDALEAGETVDFTSGQSSTGPAASILVSPDTVTLTEGATYQLTATVRDAAGNLLIDDPVTWATSDTGLTVSVTGLVTALAPGFYNLFVTLNGLTGFAQVVVVPGVPASVTIAPVPATVGASGDTIILTATVRDAGGRLIRYPTLSWTSSAPAVATVAPYGNAGPGLATVTGVSLGSATITATSGAARGTAAVTVVTPPPVASVTVLPDTATMLLGLTLQLSATVRDANGKVLPGRAITWTTDAAVARVSATGLVTGVGGGSTAVIATSEGVADSSAITVVALRFGSVAVGAFHSCGINADGAAYCWGHNADGALGDGTTITRVAPTAVGGELTFTTMSGSSLHTCGVVNGGAAYCWGDNFAGKLGDGSTTDRTAPAPVAGGLTFASVGGGAAHSCGLTPGGAAYCWGRSREGQLGNGNTTGPEACPFSPTQTVPCSTVPMPVAGGLTFSSISVGTGGLYTCGLTTSGAAYCWGDNFVGQLGDGTTTSSSVPVAVTGGLTFTAIFSGRFHACGITAGTAAYCWGANGDGQLGDGTTTNRLAPVPVGGGLSFDALAGGHYHTCGITTGGAAHCWGANGDGQLGNGTYTSSSVPVPVTGGHTVTAASAGYGHTCAIATTGTTYCWGYNAFAQLGDGTFTTRNVPLRVVGQP
jgi:alpha-tubulin suppressor-like RCC1 family protein